MVLNGVLTFNATVRWDPIAKTITITFGNLTGGSATRLSGVTPKTAKYGPPAGLTDIAGNALPTATFTSPTASSF